MEVDGKFDPEDLFSITSKAVTSGIMSTFDAEEAEEDVGEFIQASAKFSIVACDLCGRIFKCKFGLAMHKRQHGKNKLAQSTVDNQEDAHAGGLSKHRDTHTNASTSECDGLPETISHNAEQFEKPTGSDLSSPQMHVYTKDLSLSNRRQRPEMIVHVHTRTQNQVQLSILGELGSQMNTDTGTLLPKCDAVLPGESQCQENVLGIKNLAVHYRCDVCGRLFKTPHDLLAHKKSHIDGTPSTMTHPDDSSPKSDVVSLNKECVETTQMVINVRSELENNAHVKKYIIQYRCDVCGKFSSSLGDLRLHKKTHLQCTICGKKFTHGTELSTHVNTCTNTTITSSESCAPKESHTTEKIVSVHSRPPDKVQNNSVVDRKKLSIVGELGSQMNTDTGTSLPKCDAVLPGESQCQENVLGIKNLAVHYKCDVCGRLFKTPHDVLAHKKSRHIDGTPMHASELTSHVRTHPDDSSPKSDVASLNKECGETARMVINVRSELENNAHVKKYIIQYRCDVCGKFSSSLGDLGLHKKTHLQCTICGKKFTDGTELSTHVNTCTNTTITSSESCAPKESHTREKIVGVHSRPPDKVQNNSVVDRKKLSTEGDGLAAQKQSEDVQVQPHGCDMCRKVFPCADELSVHKKSHVVGKTCDVCGKECLSSSSLRDHKRNTHNKTIECDVCGKKWSSRTAFRVHKRVHTGEKPFKCDVCGKCFRRAYALSTHKTNHTGIKPHKCGECGESFAVPYSLRAHQRIHTGEKPYKCDFCNEAFPSLAHRSSHIKDQHAGDTSFKCDVCGIVLKSQSALTTHKLIHTGEAPYKCDTCDKTFTTSANLVLHKRNHTGEKPYKCDVCEKTFKAQSSLTVHKRNHTGETPYKCDVCDKAFKAFSGLVAHRRNHTEEKPYKCDVCEKAFKAPSALTVHKRNHTGETPYKCDLCDKAFKALSGLVAHRKSHT